MIREAQTLPDEAVSKKKYLELLAKYKRLQAHLEKLLREKEEWRWKPYT
jgi:hypothetical protein